MFIIELVYNLSTLVALSIISGFIQNRWAGSKTIGYTLQGILFGIVAILGMINPLVFEQGIVFDGRSVVISLCGLFFGPIAGTISATMAIILRIYQGGAGVYMGVSVVAASALIGIFYYYRRRKKEKKVDAIFLLGFGLFVHAVMLMLTSLLPKESAIAVLNKIGFAIITFYPLATILIGKILHDQEVKLKTIVALKKSEELFRTLAQSSPVGICKVTRQNEILYVNERWCEIVGFSCGELIKRNITDSIFKEDLPVYTDTWQKFIAGTSNFSIEFRMSDPDGSPRWVLCQFEQQINADGEVTGYVGSLFDINERKQYEEKLRTWEMVFKSTRLGVSLSMAYSNSFEVVNPAFAQMHGYQPDEMIGKSISKILSDNEFHKFVAEQEIAYSKGFHLFELKNTRKDGTVFPALISLTIVYNRLGQPKHQIVNVQDITERYQAEENLKNERLRLKYIITGTNVGTWEWNIGTGEVIINERWAEIIGYKLKDLEPVTNKTWEQFVHPEDLERSNSILKDHFEKKIDYYDCEVRMKHKEGHWIWVLDRGSVAEWSAEGKPLMMYGTHKDITERKRWEDTIRLNDIKLKEQNEEYIALNEELTEVNNRLRESQQRLKEQNEEYIALNEELTESNEKIKRVNNELQAAKKKAEESDRLKSAFLANMSHEIRTPMNAIMGFSEILLRPNLPPEKQQVFAEVINSSCNQLLGLINDVLDISKIETGQMSVNTGSTNINELLNNTHRLFKPNAEKKKIEFNFHPGLSDSESTIFTDEVKFIQIINNLISNAIKFTKKGAVNFGYFLNGNQLEFFVSDTGIGIESQNYEKIFDRFWQVETSESHKYGGTGLGLPISKAFVEMLGGNISLESVLGEGSTFKFTIPYLPSQLQKIAKSNQNESFNFAGKTILIAEDEKANEILIAELLKATNAILLHTANGKEAIEALQSNSNIDLILMDLKMPVMSGIDATKKIREFNQTVPIIAITAHALGGDKEKCTMAGCNDYVAKPIDSSILFKTIAKHLNIQP